MPNQIETVYPGLEGTIINAYVYEATPANVVNAISVNEPWGVQVKWELSGPFASFLNLLGKFELVHWDLKLHLESIGPNPSHDFSQELKWGTPIPFGWTYNFAVAAQKVGVDAYKPVITVRASLTGCKEGETALLPIYGFEELPMISIF